MRWRFVATTAFIGLVGCGNGGKVGTGKPGEFSREAVERGAFAKGQTEPPKEDPEIGKGAAGRRSRAPSAPSAPVVPEKKK